MPFTVFVTSKLFVPILLNLVCTYKLENYPINIPDGMSTSHNIITLSFGTDFILTYGI